jgi:hypothetical protein
MTTVGAPFRLWINSDARGACRFAAAATMISWIRGGLVDRCNLTLSACAESLEVEGPQRTSESNRAESNGLYLSPSLVTGR